MALHVYYGFTKLTPKAVRKPELCIYYENARNNPAKNRLFIERRMEVVWVREQSAVEKTDAKKAVRMFTKYGYFIDERPWKGDIDKLLEFNYIADKNQVKKAEREDIRRALREKYFSFYNRMDKNQQLKLNL